MLLSAAKSLLAPVHALWKLANADPLVRGWVTVTTASVLRLLLGLIASVAIARSLGPASYGVYALLGVVATLAGVVCDPGLTAAGVKRIAQAIGENWTEANRRISSFAVLRGTSSIALLLLVGLGLGLPASWYSLGVPDRRLVFLVMVGVVASALSGALTSVLQAAQRFGRLSAVLLTNASLTAVLAIVLARTGHLDLVGAIAVLGIGTSVASTASAWFLLPGVARPSPVSPPVIVSEFQQLVQFGRWIWLADLLAIAAGQLDLPVVSRWVGPSEVGAYALALSLAGKADVANHSLFTVLQPAASSLVGHEDVRDYVRRGLARSAIIALGLLLLIPLAGPIVGVLYSPSFSDAAGLLQLLLGVAIVDVFLTPASLLAYHYDRPKLLASADAVRIIAFIVSAILLIPLLGTTGAVIARLLARVAGGCVVLGGLRMPEGLRRFVRATEPRRES
jgi:PST family polysaccharide transporter